MFLSLNTRSPKRVLYRWLPLVYTAAVGAVFCQRGKQWQATICWSVVRWRAGRSSPVSTPTAPHAFIVIYICTVLSIFSTGQASSKRVLLYVGVLLSLWIMCWRRADGLVVSCHDRRSIEPSPVRKVWWQPGALVWRQMPSAPQYSTWKV